MENKKKKVLIAMDYSHTSKKVAEQGYALAKMMHAEVTLLHVIAEAAYYSPAEYSPIMGFTGYNDLGLSALTIEGIKKTSHDFLEKSKAHLGDGSVKTLVAEGDFAATIVQTAADIHADMIVLGSHSRRWLEEVVMGSVTEKVLHHSTIPLFIIPTKKK